MEEQHFQARARALLSTPTMAEAGMCIDLTIDDDDGAGGSQNTRGSSEEYLPAIAQGGETSRPPLTFASFEVKALSTSRIAYTRLPDVMQHTQSKKVFNASDPATFLAYIQEGEESSAALTLTNAIDPDLEPNPPADFAFTDHYILTNTLEKVSRQVDSSTVIPRGCNCDNELGVCDPRTCTCYAIHEQLAPNPWVMQTRQGEDGRTEHHEESEFRYDFAYNRNGKLKRELVQWPRTPIWECNSRCSCTEDCRNRVVQKGRTVGLDVFKSLNKGWGVRTKQALKAGTFVTVYAGELIGYSEAERRGLKYDKAKTTYILDIDSYHIKHNLIYRPYAVGQRSKGIIADEYSDEWHSAAEQWATDSDTTLLYSVDAGLWGNVSRFFNHSCEPNMEIYPIYTEIRDLRRPFLAFFTNADVPEGAELTFSYVGALNESSSTLAGGEKVEEIRAEASEALQDEQTGTALLVTRSDGKNNLTLKGMKCGCGTPSCKGTVFI